MVADADYGVVFSFGVNDTMWDGGRVRVKPELVLASLAHVLDE